MRSLSKVARAISALAITLAASGCSLRPDPEEFRAPEVGECHIQFSGYRAVFSCDIKGENFNEAGFIFDSEVILAEPDGNRISIEVSGLEPNSTHAITAFLSNGRSQVKGPEKTFTVEETDPVIAIPDTAFRAYLLKEFDTNKDGQLSELESENIHNIDCKAQNIRSLEGIENFRNLESLTVQDEKEEKGMIREINLSKNNRLRCLIINGCNARKLILPESPEWLTDIHCWGNRIDSLDFTRLPRLKLFWGGGNHISKADFSKCPDLERLACSDFDLYNQGLDLSNNPNLVCLECTNCGLKSLDFSHNPNLDELRAGSNLFKEIDLSKNLKITHLSLGGSSLTSLDISFLKDLEELDLCETRLQQPIDPLQFKELINYGGNNNNLGYAPQFANPSKMTDVHICGTGGAHYIDKDYFRQFPALKSINFGGYPGEELDLSANTQIQYVWGSDMPILKVLDLSASPYLKEIYINECPNLRTVYLSKSIAKENLKIESNNSPVEIIYK